VSAAALYAATELGLMQDGAVYRVQLVNRDAFDDPPVLRLVEEQVRRECAALAGVDPPLVAVVHLSPEYLHDVRTRLAHPVFTEPDLFDRIGAVLGVVPPRRAAARRHLAPVSELDDDE
jgi:hypothetical protein